MRSATSSTSSEQEPTRVGPDEYAITCNCGATVQLTSKQARTTWSRVCGSCRSLVRYRLRQPCSDKPHLTAIGMTVMAHCDCGWRSELLPAALASREAPARAAFAGHTKPRGGLRMHPLT